MYMQQVWGTYESLIAYSALLAIYGNGMGSHNILGPFRVPILTAGNHSFLLHIPQEFMTPLASYTRSCFFMLEHKNYTVLVATYVNHRLFKLHRIIYA